MFRQADRSGRLAQGEMPLDWNSVAKLSQEAFREGVNEWIGKARIQGGLVKGPAATLTPGSLVSDANIERDVVQRLIASKVPAEISQALAKELAAAWKQWAEGFTLHLPNAYPSFAAFPGPAAPPTPTATGAIPLSMGSSTGEASLTAAVLANRLGSALRLHALKISGGSPDQAAKSLATWIEGSFSQWKGLAKLVGVMGQGSAPTFAPPYVPVAPVVRGENLSAGPVFAGPRFGKVSV
jgi:hypothetical protein